MFHFISLQFSLLQTVWNYFDYSFHSLLKEKHKSTLSDRGETSKNTLQYWISIKYYPVLAK